MSHHKFPITEHVRAELKKHGILRWRNVKVRKESYDKLLASINSGGYDHLSADEKHALAIGCCMTHPDHKDKHRAVAPRLAMIVAVIGLLLLFATSAHCQGTSQIDVITFQDSSNVTVKSFASPFRIKAGTGLTFSVSGSVLTITPSGGTGTVTSVSVLSPLFTTTNPTTTPTFVLSNVAGNTVFGNNTSGSAAPGFQSLVLSQLPGSGAVTVNTSAPLGGGGSLSLGGSLTLTCTGCLTSVTGHNLLSLTHTDTLAHTPVRGDIIAGNSTPAWAAVARGGTNIYPKWNSSGDVVPSSLAASGVGACGANQFETADNADAAPTCAQPAFTNISGTATAAQEPSTTVNSVANDTNVTGSIAGQVLTFGWAGTLAKTRNLGTAVYTDQSNAYSAATIQTVDILLAKRFTNAPIFYPDTYAGTDMCDKIATLIASAEFIAVASSIIDARGFTGDQNCATSNPFATTHSTKWNFNPGLHVHLTRSAFTFGPATSSLIAAPSAPTLATATTGGSLAAATTYGVKVELRNLSGPTTPSAEATKLTGAGATNSITVTSPTVAFPAYTGAVCYDVFSATPVGSGWKKNNLSGCIALGTNYVIQTVGTGAIPDATNLAANDQYEVDFGGSTWSIESNTALILAAVNNTYFHDLTLINSTTLDNGVANAYVNSNISHVVFERITSAGGRIGFAINNGDTDIRFSNLRWGNPTVGTGGQEGIYITSGGGVTPSNIVIDGFELLPSVFNTTTFISAGILTNPCNDCTIQRVRCTNVDMSLSAFGGCIEIGGNNTPTGGSTNIHVMNVFCDTLIWMDCVAVNSFSSNVTIDDVTFRNSNTVAGINGLTTFQQGDCLDIFMASNINVTNVLCQNLNTLSHTLPSVEIFDTQEVSLTNVKALDSAAGLKLFGAPSTHLNGVGTSRNFNTGYLIIDYNALVTCNGTTSVVFVSGPGGFGPWVLGTGITINGVPHQISSVTDGTHLVTQANCAVGASVTMLMPTTDVSIVNPKADDNGTNATGTGSRTGTSEGIFVSGGSQVTILGGSANDNKATASKTQQYGLRLIGTARARVVDFDASNNVGAVTAPCTGVEYGANVAGNHAICDDVKTSLIQIDDNAGEILQSSNFKRVTADVTNATTTFATITGLTFNAAASFNYRVECNLVWQTNTLATGGLKLQLIGPAAPTNVLLTGEIWNDLIADSTAANLGASSATVTGLTTAMNGKAAVRANATNYIARIHGLIENGTTAGLVSVQFAEQGAGTATIKRGSSCVFDGVR